MNFIGEIVSTFWFQSIIKLLLGFVLAGIIGLERSSWNKPAGFRTHALVGLSAVLIMLCGEYMSKIYDMDPSRIPAQLLSGIGFIGAGTILRDGFNVKGLTTAAGLLTVTCIGLSIGAGFYLGGIIATIITYVILSYSYKIFDKLNRFYLLNLEIKIDENVKNVIAEIERILTDFNVDIKQMKKLNDNGVDGETVKILCEYNKKDLKKNELMSKLTSVENVSEILEDN